MQTVHRAAHVLISHELHQNVAADAGGPGAPMTAQLREFRIYARGVHNGASCTQKEQICGPGGGELVRFQADAGEMIIPEDSELIKPSDSFRAVGSSTTRTQEFSSSLRSRSGTGGLCSPDHAEAMIGAAAPLGRLEVFGRSRLPISGPDGVWLFRWGRPDAL